MGPNWALANEELSFAKYELNDTVKTRVWVPSAIRVRGYLGD